jgi:hypothetical protein
MTFPIRALRRPRSLPIALLTASVLSTTAVYPCLAQDSAATTRQDSPALPSGLAPISQLMVGGSELALDSNGNLFRMDDHGKHWKQIHQQWEGKAIELLGIPALTSAPGSGQMPKPDGDPETYAAVLLKSTASMHWVSVDRGKTWRLSNLDDVRRNDVRWSGAE